MADKEELRDGLARALLAHDEYTGLGFIRDREKAYWLEKADAALAYLDSRHADCKCDLRTRLVGDGCEICNPAKALEYAKETISDLRDGHAEFVRAVRAAADVMEDGWLIRIYNIRALCDAQLEKEPSNG